MTLLFFISEIIARLVDRRRRAKSPEGSYEAWDDDEISPIESSRDEPVDSDDDDSGDSGDSGDRQPTGSHAADGWRDDEVSPIEPPGDPYADTDTDPDSYDAWDEPHDPDGPRPLDDER
jgi:hypothetical protein